MLTRLPRYLGSAQRSTSADRLPASSAGGDLSPEEMDVGSSNGWRMNDVVPSAEMPLIEAEPNYSGEVAERWSYADGSGEIGVISSVTQVFCSTCTRARLSTKGKLYTCLVT